jgi:hypothetical protein
MDRKISPDGIQLRSRSKSTLAVVSCRRDYPDKGRANAARIVHTWNCHDELLGMLERLAHKVKRANTIQHSGGRVIAEDWSELDSLTNEAQGIITRAKEGTT